MNYTSNSLSEVQSKPKHFGFQWSNDVQPDRLLSHFRKISCLHISYPINRSSDFLRNAGNNTPNYKHNIPDYRSLNTYCCKNLKSHIIHICVNYYANPILSRHTPYGFQTLNRFRSLLSTSENSKYYFHETWYDLSSGSFYEHK